MLNSIKYIEQKTESVNIAIFEYEQNGTILTAKGESVTTKDAARLRSNVRIR